MGSPKQLGFTLKACGWRAQFTPVSDKRAASAKPMHDRYRLSHQVEFTREDGSLFTAAEAEDFLAKLSLFLSFCHGQWVATSFIAAVNPSGEVALEQWGTGRVSPWREPSGWLDEHHRGTNPRSYTGRFARSCKINRGVRPSISSSTGSHVPRPILWDRTEPAFCCKRRWNDLPGTC